MELTKILYLVDIKKQGIYVVMGEYGKTLHFPSTLCKPLILLRLKIYFLKKLLAKTPVVE